jgi:hypothetical protein
MNHLPFEIWLLSEEPLSTEDSQALQDHLQECEQCSRLREAWSGVEVLFADVPEIEPQPGFVNNCLNPTVKWRNLSVTAGSLGSC